MLSLLIEALTNPQTLATILVALAAGATAFTVATPLFESDPLAKRMKAVSVERDQMRLRERERLGAAKNKAALRQEPKAYMKDIVDRFKLGDWLGTETAKTKLLQAGFRGKGAETSFLFFRLVAPIGFILASAFYIFVVEDFELAWTLKVGAVIVAGFIGAKAPEIFLANATKKRQAEIRSAWPDALDLMLICVEAGMSIEQAFRRVGQEIGAQSVALAEELALTTAELSYLPERRHGYENLAMRTGLDNVKAVTTALIQAERYGTPVGTALRVLSQESRDQRMGEAEKKAASLPPKLTVPMIVFFLPVLFVVILTPALVQVFEWK